MAVLTNKQFLWTAGAIALGLWWITRPQRLEKINPASRENFVYQGVSNIGQAVTDDENWSLGTWIYDSTHENGERSFTWPWEYDSVADDFEG